MRTNDTIFYVLFIFVQISFGQNGVQEIRGEISVDNDFISSVEVVNLSTGKKTIANSSGYFSVFVKEGDVLVFSAFNLESLEVTISKAYLARDLILIKMKQKSNQLDEVIVNKYPNINAKTLGIVPENQKTYTQAERKLKTAGDFKPIMLLGLLGGSMPLDPLINKINGRTKRLKKQLLVEGKAANLKKLNYYFEDNYYTDKLKIPLEYINEFKLYIIENDTFVSKLKSNDKLMIDFLMLELATKYKEIIACENQ